MAKSIHKARKNGAGKTQMNACGDTMSDQETKGLLDFVRAYKKHAEFPDGMPAS